jgi:hypothetical protein
MHRCRRRRRRKLGEERIASVETGMFGGCEGELETMVGYRIGRGFDGVLSRGGGNGGSGESGFEA